MAHGKVMARGQITLPKEVRRKAHIKPGDVLEIEALGPGEVRVTVLPRIGPRELRDRYPITVPIDEVHDREAWQRGAAQEVLNICDA